MDDSAAVDALRKAVIQLRSMERYWTPPSEDHRVKTARKIASIENSLVVLVDQKEACPTGPTR